MPTSHTRSNSHRGLLTGLLVLIAVASAAVAMTARGASPRAGSPRAAPAIAAAPPVVLTEEDGHRR